MGVLYARTGGAWVPVASGSPDQRWYSAWGQIAVNNIAVPANATAATNGLVLCGANNVTLLAGRRYRMTFQIRALEATASGTFNTWLYKNGAAVSDQDCWVQTASTYENASFSFYVNGDGSTANYSIVVLNVTGSPLKVYMGMVAGNVFSVEDIGPVTGAALIPQVAISPWTTLTLQNGWVNTGSGTGFAAYRTVGDMVYLRGRIQGGSTTQTMFTLPAGARPPYRMDFTVPSINPSDWTFGLLELATAGTMAAFGPTGTLGISLDQVFFSVTT